MTILEDHVAAAYDKGVLDGLRMAHKIVDACPGTTTRLIKDTIQNLIDDPPPNNPPNQRTQKP